MVRYYTQYRSNIAILRIAYFVNSRDGVDFALLFTLRESRRTSDPVLSGIAVAYYSFTRDALALKPSGFCNVGVDCS